MLLPAAISTPFLCCWLSRVSGALMLTAAVAVSSAAAILRPSVNATRSVDAITQFWDNYDAAVAREAVAWGPAPFGERFPWGPLGG